MPEDAILYEVRDRVAWVTINRLEACNALNKAVRDGIRAAWERFNADGGAAVGVLASAGDRAESARPSSAAGPRRPSAEPGESRLGSGVNLRCAVDS